MENKMTPEEQADLDKLLAMIDFDHPDTIKPQIDPDGPALVFTPDIPQEEREEVLRKWNEKKGPSKYKDLPMPVIDVKVGGKVEKPWRIVVPMEVVQIIDWNLKRLGYPNTTYYFYTKGSGRTARDGEAEMRWREWPDWDVPDIPYFVETDAPPRLVHDLIDRIVESDECAAWAEDALGIKSYTAEEWAVSADNPDNV